MSRCVVTGASGFIGSHLCEKLLDLGHSVIGIDAFVPYYPRHFKEWNLERLREHRQFLFVEQDLRYAELNPLVNGADVVFHLAAMAGLMKSWSSFQMY